MTLTVENLPKFVITFEASGRGKAQCPADPNYPHGVLISPPGPGPRCRVELPYPAAECGMWVVSCSDCHLQVAITAAGRPDDPRGIMLPCAPPPDLANAAVKVYGID